jgi:hypothetical protein
VRGASFTAVATYIALLRALAPSALGELVQATRAFRSRGQNNAVLPTQPVVPA